MLPLLQISVDTGGVTPLQTLLAVWLLLLFLGLLLAAGYKMSFLNLSEEQTRQKKYLQGQRESHTPRSVRLDPKGDIHSHRDTIRQLFDRDDYAPDRLDDNPTLRGAVATAIGELRSAFGRRFGSIPGLTIRLLELGILITLFGGLVTLSAETIRRLVTTDDSISMSYIIETSADVVTQVATTAVDVFGAFPYAATLWQLAFAYSVLTAELLYNNPFIVAAGLGVLAVVVAVLDRRVPDAVNRSIAPRRSQAVLVLLVAFVTVWGTGAAVATGLTYLPFVADRPAAVVALALASLVMAVWVYVGTRWFVRRVGTLVQTIEGTSTAGATYLLVRRLALVYGSLAALLVPAYLVSLVASGELAAKVAALASASLPVKVAAGIIGVVVLVATALIVRNTFEDIATAILNISARSAVRARLIGRGVPILAFVFAYFLLVAFGLGAVLAGGGAAIVAVVTYGVVTLVHRAKRYATVYDPPERPPLSLVIVGYRLTTADGDTIYVGRLNTTWFAHSDPDTLTSDLVEAASAVADLEDVPASVSKQHAEDAFRFGIVDVEETRDRIEQDVRDEAKGHLRKHGMLNVDTLEEKLSEYPDGAVRNVLFRLRIHGEVRRQDGYYFIG